MYNCTCANGPTPNISDYTQTLPSLVCAEWIADCVDAHPNDQSGIAGCRSLVCGSKNVTGPTVSSSSASSSATTTTSSSAASSSAASTSTTTSATAAASSTGAAVINVAKDYGTGILATGLLALFGLAL